MDVIIFSLIRHDAPISSTSLALAKVLCHTNRVIYLDHPSSFKDVIKESGLWVLLKRWWDERRGKFKAFKIEHNGHAFWAVKPWMSLPINGLKPGKLYDLLAKYNDRRLHRLMRSIIKHYQIGDYIFVNAMDPWFFHNIKLPKMPSRTVYYMLDDIAEVPYTARHGLRLEDEKLRKSDIAFATSRELIRLKKHIRPDIYFLPNAVDFQLFHKASLPNLEKPAELADIHSPIIAYVGHLDFRVNREIVFGILEAHTDKTLLVIGPSSWTDAEMARLHSYPNFKFLGPRKIDQLPAYMKYFAVGIIPFEMVKVTRSIYPLKVNEYLAAGLPVVATPFSDDILDFSHIVALESSKEGFVEAINRVIKSNSPEVVEQRYEIASSNTWERRVDYFWEVLKKHPN